MNEFSLIKQFFTRSCTDQAVIIGVGDDSAIWRPRPDRDLAIAADMLVEGRHFFAEANPFDIGYKSMMVNISDMAAMGAIPVAATLCLALPAVDSTWLNAFADGFWSAANTYSVDLIGGDTTRGPLTIAIQMWGELPKGQRLLRSTAQIGDDIWVSGTLGGAAVGLQFALGQMELEPELAGPCLRKLHRPEARVELGVALLNLATAALDISDGLLADLGHILEASGVGARLQYAKIPVISGLETRRDELPIREAVLGGGDDYELCFTAPGYNRAKIGLLAEQLNLPLTRIGVIEAGKGIFVEGKDGEQLRIRRAGFDHFGPGDS